MNTSVAVEVRVLLERFREWREAEYSHPNRSAKNPRVASESFERISKCTVG
jgi:hypothetical protein